MIRITSPFKVEFPFVYPENCNTRGKCVFRITCSQLILFQALSNVLCVAFRAGENIVLTRDKQLSTSMEQVQRKTGTTMSKHEHSFFSPASVTADTFWILHVFQKQSM
jgi:hypothetical protein